MSQKSDLSLIILNFNGQFWLKKTLLSLKEQYLRKTQYLVDVMVVDNGSSDESVEMVKKQFKWVKIIPLENNVGFAAGNNVALKEVKSEFAMLLNSDVELTSHSNFDVLIEFMRQEKKVGVVTPRLNLVNGELDQACHRGEPTVWASFTYFSKLEKIFPATKLFGAYHQTYQNLKTVHVIDACSGAAMMVKVSALKKVGYLDEQFFMYAEDLDWCKRFREAGFLVVYHPGVSLIHHKYKSGLNSYAQQLQRKTTAHFYDTMLQYYDKHYQDKYPRFVRSIIKYTLALKKGGL